MLARPILKLSHSSLGHILDEQSCHANFPTKPEYEQTITLPVVVFQ